jgi:hypothetical protein
MFLYIPCIYPNHYNCNCPYNIKDVNTCAYIEKQNYNSLILRKEDDALIEQMYTTKDKTLALLNINSPITSIRLVAKFILGLNHCVFKHPTDRSNYLNLKD